MAVAIGSVAAYAENVMSVILAVRDNEDVVLASDGRVVDYALVVMSEESLKTLALNTEVCLGLAGPTDTMRQVLTSLGVKCRGTHPIDLLGACQEISCPVEVDYLDARNEVASVLRWMARRVPLKDRLGRIPAVILAGRVGKHPALSEWSYPTWRMDESGPGGYSEAVVGSLPDAGSGAWQSLHRMVRGGQTTKGAEERLAGAVRFCANYFGANGPINKNVFLRRLSHGFHLDRG